MIRYLFLLCIYTPFYLLAMLLAPVLPLFAELRNGPTVRRESPSGNVPISTTTKDR